MFADEYDKKLQELNNTAEWFTIRSDEATSKIGKLETKKATLILKLD
jgi:hypothetical protein